MKINIPEKHFGKIAAGIAFLGAYGFFQIAYPYHLMRREQLNLFLYDWQYITDTYKGIGWLSRFAGDFVDQFLYFPVLGPVLVALILTAIGTVAYRICRHFLGKWPSLCIAAVIFGWSFMRETDNLYITQYSLAILGYLSLILLSLQFKKNWAKATAFLALAIVGTLSIGNPYDKYYGKLWGKPTMLNEKLIALDVNAARGNWDKVLKLSKDDLYTNEASYMYNLAIANKGKFGDELFNHSQNYTNGLILWINDNVSQLTFGMAGEAWFQLGDMTLAEQSAIIALQHSPKHTGARFLTRLAEIGLVSGEEGSAVKFLNTLSHTLKYRKWALSMMPGNMNPETQKWLQEARSKLSKEDIVYSGEDDCRTVLEGLVKANPDNLMARQYLYAYDLLNARIDLFIENYAEHRIEGAIFEQAALIWLIANNEATEEAAMKLGISNRTLQKLNSFYRYPESNSNTYWYYYSDVTAQ